MSTAVGLRFKSHELIIIIIYKGFASCVCILNMPSYRRLQQYAIVISIISVIYNGLEGGLSIGFGAESGSRSLIFFGIQSGVEVISAFLVLWRFRKVAKPGEERGAILSEQDLRFANNSCRESNGDF
jgi:hypothetical protein